MTKRVNTKEPTTRSGRAARHAATVANANDPLTPDQLKVLAEYAKVGRLRVAAHNVGVDHIMAAEWVVHDNVFAEAYKHAESMFREQLVADYLVHARAGIEKTADAISWMFLVKQADPSYRDNAKLQIEANQAFVDIVKDIQSRVKRRTPAPRPTEDT